jgi:hypothetical protein
VLADGASGTVVCGNDQVPAGSPHSGNGSADGALTCWYRRHGDTRWQARLPDAGRLPDVGAVALGDQEILGLCAAQNRFIAVGASVTSINAETGAGTETGSIWLSEDGMTWSKLPTAASGLTHFSQLDSVAEYDEVAIATGDRTTDSDPTSYEISTPPQP